MANYGGILAAAFAFFCWGILPVYWKLLQDVPAYEILCHRMAWSLILTILITFAMRRQHEFWKMLCNRRNLLVYGSTASLLALNWVIYIWAVNAGHIIETSLGYFINPLINVLFGMIFFQERMRPIQWLALFLVFLGVVYLTVYYGRFPWIALVLAFSFGTYGLLHKKHALGALDGLCLETAILFVPAVMLLVVVELTHGGAFGHIGMQRSLLLAGTGLVTTVPLLLFGFAARRIHLSTLGLLQYTAPTINLLLGIWMYGEPFPLERMIGFILIWTALALYLTETMVRRYRQAATLST